MASLGIIDGVVVLEEGISNEEVVPVALQVINLQLALVLLVVDQRVVVLDQVVSFNSIADHVLDGEGPVGNPTVEVVARFKTVAFIMGAVPIIVSLSKSVLDLFELSFWNSNSFEANVDHSLESTVDTDVVLAPETLG